MRVIKKLAQRGDTGFPGLKASAIVSDRFAVYWSLDIWKIEVVLRRSKIFIVIGIQIAISSVGAAYYGQHLHTD